MNDRRMCRICFDELHEKPQIYCKCQGSCSFVHQDCVKKWIEYRALIYRHPQWANCDLCKEEYAFRITLSHRFMIDLAREIIVYLTSIFWIGFLVGLEFYQRIEIMIFLLALVLLIFTWVFYLRLRNIESRSYPRYRDFYNWKVMERNSAIPRDDYKNKLLFILS